MRFSLEKGFDENQFRWCFWGKSSDDYDDDDAGTFGADEIGGGTDSYGSDDEEDVIDFPSAPSAPVDTGLTEGAMRDLGRSPFSTPASAKEMTLQRSTYGGENLGTESAFRSPISAALSGYDPIKQYLSGNMSGMFGRDLPASILGMEPSLREGVTRVAQQAAPEYGGDGLRQKVEGIPYIGGMAKAAGLLSDALTGTYRDVAREIAQGATPIVGQEGNVIGAESTRGIYTTPDTNRFFDMDPAVSDAYSRYWDRYQAELDARGGDDQPILRQQQEAAPVAQEPRAQSRFPTPQVSQYEYQPFVSKFYTIPSRFTQPYGLLG